jgi:hypothetical protein
VSFLRALKHSARRASSLAAVGVALGAVAAGPANAATVQGFGPVGSFGFGGSGPGGLTTPQHVAVDDATGNVLVADPGNGRVEVFQPDGSGSANYLTEFGSAAISQPYGVAVDQGTGDVYVSGNDGVQPKIARFTSDGQATPTYTLDATFTSPAAGAGAGQIGDFNSPIAVDPSTHDLIVGDRGNKRIDRFSSTGTFIRAFDGSAVPGAITAISDVAATASDIYVTDFISDNIFGTGASRVLRFTAAGAYQAIIGKADTPVVAAVDAATGNVVAAGNTQYDRLMRLSVYRGSTLGASSDFAAGAQGATATGIAVGGGANRHVYVVTDTQLFGSFGTTGVQTFDPAPGVEADDVTSADSRSVDLAGLVNPEGNATTAHFEWLDNGTWTPLPDVPGVGSGTTDQSVSTHLAGLDPVTRYSFRLVATDGRTTAVSLVATATTAGEAPAVVTGGSSEPTTSTASVQGTVNPLGLQTTYYFEYGTTSSYGSRSPAGAPGVAGNGHGNRAVSAELANLVSGTAYHYRLVATNSAGTTYGADNTFTTGAGSATRGYEMVSPAQKTGAPVDSNWTGFKSSPDGNAIVYTTQKAAYDDAHSAPYQPRVLGTRSPAAWSSIGVDPPLTTSVPGRDTFWATLSVSDDFQHALVLTTRKLGAEGADGNGNLYVRDLRNDSYDLVASSADPHFYEDLAGTGGEANYLGGTSDFSRVVIDARVALTPDAPRAGNYNVYTWTRGAGLQLASVMPDGTPAVGAASGENQIRDRHPVSDDGSRIFFQVIGTGLFMRENGRTVPISVSQRTGDPATLQDAKLISASPDGSFVMFEVNASSAPLTDDAPVGVDNAYRYDVETGKLDYVAPRVNGYPVEIARPANDDLFYQSNVDPDGGNRLYYAHGGTSHLIGVVTDALNAWALSPDGRYFAFQTASRLTSYDNGGKGEVYLYDAVDNNLTCLSCRTDGGAAIGDAQMGQGSEVHLAHTPLSVLDDGAVFFDSPDPLVPRDTNGHRDVYKAQGGVLSLVTPGTGDGDATFVEATPDGSNVFFVTDQRLVGQDQDGTADLYDARVGGGIAAQSPDAGPAPCGGSECHEPVSGPTTSDAAPTMTVTPRPTNTTRPAKPTIKLVRSSLGKKSVVIMVTVSSRGRIRASGSTIKATSKNATKAATYTLTVPLTEKVRRARSRGHRVKLSIRVALSAPFASPVTVKLTRTVGK